MEQAEWFADSSGRFYSCFFIFLRSINATVSACSSDRSHESRQHKTFTEKPRLPAWYARTVDVPQSSKPTCFKFEAPIEVNRIFNYFLLH